MQDSSIFYKPKQQPVKPRRKRWRIFSILWKGLRRTCMGIGAMVLVLLLYSAIASMTLMKSAAVSLPDDMILVLDLDKPVTEGVPQPGLTASFLKQTLTVHQIVDTLDAAAEDKRVRGLIASYKGGTVSLAHIQEIRAAVKRFRASGKFASIYAASFAQGGQNIGAYYLASAFGEIWMQPIGLLPVAGINMEIPFAREAMDKLGVNPQMLTREEYKSAYESLTHSEISAPNREAMRAIVRDLSGFMLSDIAADRGLSEKKLKRLIDTGFLTGREALEEKLIDRLDYGDVLVSETRARLTGDPEDQTIRLTGLTHYAAGVKAGAAKDKSKAKTKAKIKSNNKDRAKIALIYIGGMIVPTAPPKARNVAAADEVSGLLVEALKDEDIKAIILRIDSPGGAPSASETIRRAVIRAKEKGKIVIVSMGTVAASGGYWIAVDADRIFALPGTLTGSIGVIFGKFDLSAMWSKIGVNWAEISWGENASLFSFNRPFSPEEMTRMNLLIDNVYDAFVARVATGRGLSEKQARKVAKGRPWSGASAKEAGLVDALGGLDDALDYTAQQLDLTDRSDLDIRVLPRTKSLLEQVAIMLGQQARLAALAARYAPGLEQVSATFPAEAVEAMGAGPYLTYDPVLGSVR